VIFTKGACTSTAYKRTDHFFNCDSSAHSVVIHLVTVPLMFCACRLAGRPEFAFFSAARQILRIYSSDN